MNTLNTTCLVFPTVDEVFNEEFLKRSSETVEPIVTEFDKKFDAYSLEIEEFDINVNPYA